MRLGLLALILEVWVVPLRAQNTGAGIAGAALAQRVQYRLRYAGGIHDQSGTWLAAEGMAHLGLVFIRTSLASGALSGDTSAVNPDRTFRVTSLSIGIRPTAWLEFGPDVMARRVESSASTVIWRLLGGHLGIALPLGLEGLAGTATGTYYASRAVTGDEKLNLALTGELGVSFAPPGSVMMLRIAYRFERYHFDALGGNQPRLEQARSLVAGVGLSLRR